METMAPLVVVAGHLCLDVIPEFKGPSDIVPGRLIEVGPARFSTGGAVSNVGRALHRLGVPVRLIGKVGDDPFGQIVSRLLSEESPDLTKGLVVSPGGATSYSVVINPPHLDRTFLHMPGENDTFGPEDLHDEALEGAAHLHFGYPPLMARMFADGGRELEATLAKAKTAGLTVSLDTSLPDPSSPSGRAPWKEILSRALPNVDVFLPSQDELAFMLGLNSNDLDGMIRTCLEMGAKAVVIKKGDQGLAAGTSEGIRTSQSCFPAKVKGTTGAGDSTIAGFLMGCIQGWSLEQCMEAGCAVGAFCVEEPDAVSGIRAWSEVEARLISEWRS